MRACPQCHLLLEPLEWNGTSVQVCRSCGGVWLAPDVLAEALGPRREDLFSRLRELAGVASPEAFAGLARPCPDCRSVLLADGSAPDFPELCAGVCPRCGGTWLDASARTSVGGSPTTPVAAPKPVAAPLDLHIERSEEGAAVAETAPAEPDHALSAPAPQPDAAVPPLPFVMPESDDVLDANAAYSRSFGLADVPAEPARKVVVLTCMDARIPVLEMLGLRLGDAHVLRNAGGLATDDALRSLLISHHLLGTQEFWVVGHTDCGMTRFKDEDLLRHVAAETGIAQATPQTFLAFRDVRESVRDQVMRIRMHPWLEGRAAVRGFVYDVKTGRLSEVA